MKPDGFSWMFANGADLSRGAAPRRPSIRSLWVLTTVFALFSLAYLYRFWPELTGNRLAGVFLAVAGLIVLEVQGLRLLRAITRSPGEMEAPTSHLEGFIRKGLFVAPMAAAILMMALSPTGY